MSLICRDVAGASNILKVLGNPIRLAIVCLLIEGKRSVAEIEMCLDIHQPTLSQQIGVLRTAGIVEGVRHAKHVVYQVSDERARKVVLSLRPVWPELVPAVAKLINAKTTPEEATALHVQFQIAELESM